MIYLTNTYESQAVMIPLNGIAGESTNVILSLVSTSERRCVLETPIEADFSGAYASVDVELPEGIKDGEYAYYLTAEGQIIASGLTQIGAYDKMTSEGVGALKIKQGK